MKLSIIAAIGMMIAGSATAANIPLKLPTVGQMTGHACGFNGTHVLPSSVSWSLNGNYVSLLAYAMTVCSTGGRGSHGAFFYGAETITYDLFGNVASEVRAIYPCPAAGCPWYAQGTVLTYPNPLNSAIEVSLDHYVNLFDRLAILIP